MSRHTHSHGDHHAHHGGHQHIQPLPSGGPLGAGAGVRLAVAAGASALLWLAVGWALA
ncbi:hypothetical protein [Azoarcus sp. DD4]|uniref:hypothetical protein n=1 Tax=Azoarcus sp. DD4 TaxID=2027405 RepID=UPI00143DD5B0|nr:hypothetical protein [Azoarcus sp. DD4]